MAHLLFGEEAGLLSRGFYPSVCSHAASYGFGEVGFFVALFIYSKLAELFDTLWLLLRKSLRLLRDKQISRVQRKHGLTPI